MSTSRCCAAKSASVRVDADPSIPLLFGLNAILGSASLLSSDAGERISQLALPELEKALLFLSDLHERESIESGALHLADRFDVGGDVGAVRNRLGEILGPHVLRRGVEVDGVGKLRLHLPAEGRPAELAVGDLQRRAGVRSV